MLQILEIIFTGKDGREKQYETDKTSNLQKSKKVFFWNAVTILLLIKGLEFTLIKRYLRKAAPFLCLVHDGPQIVLPEMCAVYNFTDGYSTIVVNEIKQAQTSCFLDI